LGLKAAQKNCIFAFTAYNRVRKVFFGLTDQNLSNEHFLKRKVKGEKRVGGIIDANKQFGIKKNEFKTVFKIDEQ